MTLPGADYRLVDGSSPNSGKIDGERKRRYSANDESTLPDVDMGVSDWRHYADLLSRRGVLVRLVEPKEMDRMLGCLARGKSVNVCRSFRKHACHLDPLCDNSSLKTLAYPVNMTVAEATLDDTSVGRLEHRTTMRSRPLSGETLSSSISTEHELTKTPQEVVLFKASRSRTSHGPKGVDQEMSGIGKYQRTVGFPKSLVSL